MQDAVAGNKRRERKQLHPRRLPFFARAHETRFAAADDSDDGSGRCEAGCTVKKVCMGSSAVEADTGTLLATMRRMFEEVEESMTDKTDVCFRLSDGEMVHAHKCVVTSACLFIRCCMEAGMKEEKTGVIDATICDKATLLGILEYMYTGSIRIEKRSEVNILDVLHVQDQWNVLGLGMWAVSTADERCITGILEYCLDTGNGDLKESALIAVSDNEKLDECDFKGVKAEVVQWLMSNLKMGAYTCGMALADKWINQNIGVATPSDYEVIGNAVDLRRLKLNELTQIHRSEMFGSSEAVQKKFSDAISSRSGLQGEWKKDSKIDIVVATTVKAAEGKRDETNRHVVNISPTLVGFFYRHSVSIVDSRGALVNHFSKSDVPWMRIVHACRHPSSDGFIVLTSSTWGNENRWKSHFFVCDVQFKVLHKIVVSPDALFVQASQKGVVYVLDKDTGLWAYDMNTWKLIRLIVQCEDIGFSDASKVHDMRLVGDDCIMFMYRPEPEAPLRVSTLLLSTDGTKVAWRSFCCNQCKDSSISYSTFALDPRIRVNRLQVCCVNRFKQVVIITDRCEMFVVKLDGSLVLAHDLTKSFHHRDGTYEEDIVKRLQGIQSMDIDEEGSIIVSTASCNFYRISQAS